VNLLFHKYKGVFKKVKARLDGKTIQLRIFN